MLDTLSFLKSCHFSAVFKDWSSYQWDFTYGKKQQSCRIYAVRVEPHFVL